MRNEDNFRVKRLYCVIPEQLFEELKRYDLLSDVDNIIIDTLAERVREEKERLQ